MIFGRFTDRAQSIFIEAQNESQNFKHGYIGSEHILLGILKEKGFSSHILINKGVTIEKVKVLMKDYLGYGDDDVNVSEILLTPKTKRLFEDSLDIAGRFGQNFITPEHILLAIINECEGIAYTILLNCKLNFNSIKEDLSKYMSSNEVKEPKKNVKEKKNNKTPFLDMYSKDLTKNAIDDKLDPVIGRDKETQRLLEVLCRRIKNNPCLIGEPGVGKTAVVEGLAQKIVSGNIPDELKEIRLVSLDIASMVAGAKYRGEFEDRLKKVMLELKMEKDIIIFIDEIHTIVGAGGAEGAIDASNILKPALARGEIKCIGATTISEYRKNIAKDSALERRFQPVNVEEPSKEETIEILFGLREKYESHHRVKITDSAISLAVELSNRYINERYMPDKAIDLIDEAAAKVRISNLELSPELKEKQKEINKIILSKENAIKNQDFEKAALLRDEEKLLRDNFDNMKLDWSNYNFTKIHSVDEDDIKNVISSWTKIPLTKLTETESNRLLNLENILKDKVIGQDNAIISISKAIKRARAGLKNPDKPIGTFMFCGPTGVGKTQLSNVLAESVFGNKKNLIRLDMSEYMEKHSVSRLIGSPPGYVGHDEGGQLSEAVRLKPYSVILLDEIEKANQEVLNILLQIMDDGRLTDGKGKIVDFKNTILIMTSNLGIDKIKKQNKVGFNNQAIDNNEYEKMKNVVLGEIKSYFKPEFLNRLDETIIFNSLNKDNMLKIVDIMIKDTIDRLKEKNISLDYDNELSEFIANKNKNIEFGARPIRRIITKELEDILSEKLIKGDIRNGDKIKVLCYEKQIKFLKI